jgi:hypothetical protein
MTSFLSVEEGRRKTEKLMTERFSNENHTAGFQIISFFCPDLSVDLITDPKRPFNDRRGRRVADRERFLVSSTVRLPRTVHGECSSCGSSRGGGTSDVMPRTSTSTNPAGRQAACSHRASSPDHMLPRPSCKRSDNLTRVILQAPSSGRTEPAVQQQLSWRTPARIRGRFQILQACGRP